MMQMPTIDVALRLLCSLEHGRRSVELCDQLLLSEEPLGLPGLFLFSDKYAARFNRWKAENSTGRHYWGHLPVEMADFLVSNRTYEALRGLPVGFLRRWKGCELRMLLPSSLALEGLLRAGLCEHPRIQRAICTLMSLRNQRSCGRNWKCGCRYLDAGLVISEPTSYFDFDSCEPGSLSVGPSPVAALVHRALVNHPLYPDSRLAEAGVSEGLPVPIMLA